MTPKWLNILDITFFVIFLICLTRSFNTLPETPFIAPYIFDYLFYLSIIIYFAIYTIGLIRHRDPANKIGCFLKYFYFCSIITTIGLILELIIYFLKDFA